MLAAAEHQVLEKMRETGFPRLLVFRAHVVPHVHRHDRRLVVLVDDHRQPVVEHKLGIRNIRNREIHFASSGSGGASGWSESGSGVGAGGRIRTTCGLGSRRSDCGPRDIGLWAGIGVRACRNETEESYRTGNEHTCNAVQAVISQSFSLKWSWSRQIIHKN